MFMKKGLVGVGLAALLTLSAMAEEGTTTNAVPSQEEIAKMINNPLSYLWMMAMQNDTWFYDGDMPGADKATVNRFTVMPIMPMQLTEEYKLVVRPWLPIYTDKLPWGEKENFSWTGGEIGMGLPSGISETDWKSGIGDMGMWAALATNENAKPPFVWGVGVTAMFDTASKEQYGTGYNSAGPMGLAFYLGDKWIVGGILQHWWDYSGKGTQANHDGVSLTDLQYVLRYRVGADTYVGMAPDLSYNWKTETWNVPVGGGFDTLIKIGPLPVKIGMETYYYAKHGSDQLHNEWQLRIFFVPVLPSPDWSHHPLF